MLLPITAVAMLALPPADAAPAQLGNVGPASVTFDESAGLAGIEVTVDEVTFRPFAGASAPDLEGGASIPLRVEPHVHPGGGTYSASLSNGGAAGPHWLWQDITVTPNTNYIFDTWFTGTDVIVDFEYGTSWPSHMPESGNIFWAYYADGVPPNPDAGEWTHAETYSVGSYPQTFGPIPWIVTTGPTQTFLRLLFVDEWSSNNMYIDEVSLVEIPEPATLGVLGFGLLGFLIRRKR